MGARGIKSLLTAAAQGVSELFYPHRCAICGCSLDNREVVLCDVCEADLPRTEHACRRDNRVEQLLAEVPLKHSLVRGGAFGYYENDSPYRDLLHIFKYSAYPQIGVHLGRLAAKEFAEHGFFADVDLLVPVPLHRKRLIQRTYNQAELICEGIAEQTNIPLDTTNLKRVVNSDSQTRKTAAERQANTQGIFLLDDPVAWQGKHILLVDDIITTGATLKACMQAVRKVKNLRVSVFTLGVTRIQESTEEAQL